MDNGVLYPHSAVCGRHTQPLAALEGLNGAEKSRREGLTQYLMLAFPAKSVGISNLISCFLQKPTVVRRSNLRELWLHKNFKVPQYSLLCLVC